ncbi:MAG: PEGA domain-containing protein [Candidatus Tectomicrobia bacterium]|nr:PEGA domain-containing protein [Candidatus Tectomicrobia bacterium]
MKTLTLLCVLLLPLPVFADELPTLAIVDFTSAVRHTPLVRMFPDLLSEKLVNENLFDVVEREKLNTAVTELGLSGSGLVSQDKAIEVGRMLGAQYLLTGKILDFSKQKKTFRNYGTQIDTTVVRLMVSAEIVETATARKIFAKKASSSKKFNAMGGLSISDSTSGGDLANDVADKLVAAILESEKLQTILRPAKQNEEAMITITSSPDNADVEIDGVFYGNTGEPFKVPTGLHSITVTLPGYDVWEKKVMVKDGLTFNVRLSEKVDQKLKIDIKEEVQKK